MVSIVLDKSLKWLFRGGSVTRRIPLLPATGLLALGLLLSSCGGGGSGAMGSQSGPYAVSNGATAGAATTHWTAPECGLQIALTNDYGFYSIVVDTSGHTSSGPETWALGTNANSITVGPGVGGLGGFFWVSALGNIAGSTASQSFSASVTVETGSTHQSLGTCTFTLAKRNI